MKGKIGGVVIGVGLLCWTPQASAQQLRLSWVDRSYNEAGFVIERKIIGRGLGTPWQRLGEVGVNITAYVDTQVVAGRCYCYRVAAFNVSGQSRYTEVRCRTTPQKQSRTRVFGSP
jgi:hypothetical protein